MMDAGTRVFIRDLTEKVILEKHREFKQDIQNQIGKPM